MLSALETDRARLAGLDAQNQDLENSIAALRLEQERVQQERNLVQLRLDAYKYPVLTLPNEIVAEIFIRVLPVYPRCPPLTGILSPISLTHICRLWREIAISTPVPWRAVALAHNADVSSQRQAHIIDLWLKRSSSCLLSINVDIAYAERVEASKVLSSVTARHSRWEYLKLVYDTSGLPAIEDSMPMLRHLHLELIEVNPLSFREVPLLRSVVLDDFAASSIVLPWAQLTSLALRRVFLHECAPLLKQTSNLVHCDLQLSFVEYDHSDITLPCLESLALNIPDPLGPVCQYLTLFITPALRRLRIPEQFLGPDAIRSLTAFITTSGCELQELRITGKRSIPSKSYYREALHSVGRLSFSRNYYDQPPSEFDVAIPVVIESDSDSDLSYCTSSDSEEEDY
ncbi:hypothetical protein DFH08DRAFT_779614 [Mycena albidolilacea]|uniref:F-box domain-containing protein n=1 Tax=Mycena albidolilacea TaxID=1033008 RepID=A0AAD7ERE6_9AGAR|nr:hypothetical protein DFH08DRAFT_779614 [Mycena albidolilacea]